jgi:hypothetical protein
MARHIILHSCFGSYTVQNVLSKRTYMVSVGGGLHSICGTAQKRLAGPSSPGQAPTTLVVLSAFVVALHNYLHLSSFLFGFRHEHNYYPSVVLDMSSSMPLHDPTTSFSGRKETTHGHSLFSLPRELRDEIYHYLFSHGPYFVAFFPYASIQSTRMPLYLGYKTRDHKYYMNHTKANVDWLLTSKIIMDEALACFSRRAEWFCRGCDFADMPKKLPWTVNLPIDVYVNHFPKDLSRLI